jgi:hypothetical protein
VKTPRNTFGWIFLLTGLVIFYCLAASAIATELNDVLHGPPFTSMVRDHMPHFLNAALDMVLPLKVQNLPYINHFNPQHLSTNDSPFEQFNVVKWMGWAFIVGAFADIGTAYLTRVKTQVEE